MSLRATIKAAVKQAFIVTDDIPRQVTYHSQAGEPVRDIDAGTSHLTVTDYVLKKVFIVRYTVKETDKDITLKTDEKMIIFQDDLAVTPKNADTLSDDNGAVWEIIEFDQDPARVIWIVRVRSSR